MRLYLDTNILIWLCYDLDELSDETAALLYDYTNTLHTSAVCVSEFIFLIQSDKIRYKKRRNFNVFDWLSEIGVEIVPVTEKHLRKVDSLPIVHDHRDPNDRVIIAQAIADKATLVSSDTKFPLYIGFGLDLVYNKR